LIRVENINVFNFEGAFRGLRNPLESWSQSDSYWKPGFAFGGGHKYIIGEKDLELALKLIKAGSDHSKFMRQIFVSMDITAPLYWWKEMDTYKVATVANSTSTMHTLHKTKISPELFSTEKLDKDSNGVFSIYCEYLDFMRNNYLETKNKDTWNQMIQMLPSSFNQTRTWTADYQVLSNIHSSRKSHKLGEWINFCKNIETL